MYILGYDKLSSLQSHGVYICSSDSSTVQWYTVHFYVQISVSSSKVVTLVNRLLDFKELKLAGLGARDILRLEAGLCLYGNDISEEVTPVEAGLAWCISMLLYMFDDSVTSCSYYLEMVYALRGNNDIRRG